MVSCDSMLELSYRSSYSKCKNYIAISLFSTILGALVLLASLFTMKGFIGIIGILLIIFGLYTFSVNLHQFNRLKYMINEIHYKREYPSIQ